MDYEGQKLFEHLSHLLFLVEGLVCWVIGFYFKDVDLMAKVYGVVGLATMLLMTPDSKYWPVSWAFNMSPLTWLPALNPPDAPPPPPTTWEKVLKLVGISSSASPVKIKSKSKAKSR
eukprot:jgi/Ulvmu1/715/UM010_0087.1